jgi:hypothetical protein
VLEWGDEQLSLSYVLPDEALKDVALYSPVASEAMPPVGSLGEGEEV